jgi:hypothetical protein
MTRIAFVSIIASLASLLSIGVAIGLVSSGKCKGMLTIERYRRLRAGAAAFAIAFAILTVVRLATNVAGKKTIDPEFVPELVGYLIFWVLVPPLWFFWEYFAADKNWIQGPFSDEASLKKMKDYGDFASKIWAGVLALLAGLVALKTK